MEMLNKFAPRTGDGRAKTNTTKIPNWKVEALFIWNMLCQLITKFLLEKN